MNELKSIPAKSSLDDAEMLLPQRRIALLCGNAGPASTLDGGSQGRLPRMRVTLPQRGRGDPSVSFLDDRLAWQWHQRIALNDAPAQKERQIDPKSGSTFGSDALAKPTLSINC
jgi:hypothetical protein